MPFCGVDYHGPTEEERKVSLEMQEFKIQAKRIMHEMGPQAIPLMMEGLNANSRFVEQTMLETQIVFSQNVLLVSHHQ